MKNFVIFFLVLGFVMVSKAQNAPEKSNLIVITLGSEPSVDALKKVLESNGYVVKNGKAENELITNHKNLKNNTRLVVNTKTEGSIVYLTGSIVISGQSNLKVEKKPGKGSPIHIAWDELEKVAKSFKGSVAYEKK